MELEWDADKAARNLRKRGVYFEDAEFFTTLAELKPSTGARTTGKIDG